MARESMATGDGLSGWHQPVPEPVCQHPTQLTSFMHGGGRLLETKHLRRGTTTAAVGTTCKLLWRSALLDLSPRLNPAVDLAFDGHFLGSVFAADRVSRKCLGAFQSRIGISKAAISTIGTLSKSAA